MASSSLKMQRKCRKEKDKKFCLDETKRKMARYSISPKMNFWGNTNIHNPRKKVIHQRKCLFYELRHRPFSQFFVFLGIWNAKNQFLAKFLGNRRMLWDQRISKVVGALRPNSKSVKRLLVPTTKSRLPNYEELRDFNNFCNKHKWCVSLEEMKQEYDAL